ncbi:vWA domain-containing protein [Actinomadura violacea]|uniref:VWA domain-containing protein n=1 Tax=Actinomadura violacea TaxID=2819934 RepID=A0ABS3RXK2_9ACTN|nr:vWA domain-containing protein [Actinomadura violacea]MBO2461488.1 VWA domain-containing protein [Actinomadura violacea]
MHERDNERDNELVPGPRLRHIEILLDRSGSMWDVKEDTEGGLEAFLHTQREVEVPTTVTLRQFDDEYEVVYEAKPLEDVPQFRLVPRGRTALLDAIGRTLRKVGRRLEQIPAGWRPDEVIVVIVTDGRDNASQRYSPDQINGLIREHREGPNGWTFVFLGANQDAFSVAGELGIPRNTTLPYSSDRTEDSMTSAGHMVSRGTRHGRFAFTDDERDTAL